MDAHLRDLRYFVAVAERLHFTRAAEALFVSQPALSKQVRMLENQVGTALFERDRRAVRLTAAGAALLPHARAVLDAWVSAERALAAVSETVVIGMSTGVGRGLLPAVRARLSAAGLRMQVRLVPWDDPTAGLGDPTSGVDAAFCWLPIPGGDRLDRETAAIEQRLVALPAGHALAARDTVALVDLLDEPFLALPSAAGELREYWLATAERQGRPAVIGAEVSTAEETAEAVVAGLGVVLVAEGNAPLLARDGVVLRPVAGVSPSELVLAWRSGDDRPVIGHVRAAVRAASARPDRPHAGGTAGPT